MKEIQPVLFIHGKPMATQLLVRIVFDDLSTTATFYWAVYTANDVQLFEGNETLSGEDYLNWNGNNDYPYQYVAQKQNLTLI